MKRPRSKLTSPLLPSGVDIIVPPPPFEACTLLDKLLCYTSSLIVVGSPLWFYGGIIYLYRKWKKYRALAACTKQGVAVVDDDEYDNYTSSGESSQEQPDSMQQYTRYKKLVTKYGAALALILLVSIVRPHSSRRLGEWFQIRKWRLWEAWLRYVGFTVLHDKGSSKAAMHPPSSHKDFDPITSPAIYAFVPHGIFPFALGFGCLTERYTEHTWGILRPVVATATRLFPLVRTVIDWLGCVDASRNAVSSALSQPNTRLGISPGGIAEMFETYPKPGFHPNDEAALLKHRNGIFKLALKHNVPIIPVYCFGATKMFRRVQLPQFIETLSRALKISLCLLFGKMGLPIPFRQRLMYVIGNTIWPTLSSDAIGSIGGEEFNQRVEQMHSAFCDEIVRIFDRNKGHYGWADKTLRLV